MRIQTYRWLLLTFAFVAAGIVLSFSTLRGSAETSQQGGQNPKIYLPLVAKPSIPEWPMAGANPERTSWTPEEIKGSLDVEWYTPFEPYIPSRVQIVAANGLLYISTAKGLYALNAGSGFLSWVYPTELPLGQSPTIHNSIAYAGGLDHKIHAINALTGQGLWTFEGGAGFDTSPLVVNGKVYAGNRDGTFYALDAEGAGAGTLVWSYTTGGPIHFSAAYKDGVVFFASNDSYAYALNAENGQLVWKSDKLPVGGFHSWWPVVYQDKVIFVSSHNYSSGSYLGAEGGIHALERETIYPNRETDPRGLLVGPINKQPGTWVPGTPTINTSQSEIGSTFPITEYFETYPWRRTYFVLDRFTGEEYTTDFDGDTKVEYAPILWSWTKTGTRYPPVVGGDGVIYQANDYMSDEFIPGGQVSGWEIGTPFISVVSSDWGAIDEPHAYSAGGSVIYWNQCCDRRAGGVDISTPNTDFYDRYTSGILPPTGGMSGNREWVYFAKPGDTLESKIPGYNDAYDGPGSFFHPTFGGRNGTYGFHGDQNPPIPYMGRIYLHRGNSIIAFGDYSGAPVERPIVTTVPTTTPPPSITSAELQARLEEEIQAIVDAGHLRPGFASTGYFDLKAISTCGDALTDYFHHPGEIITTLIRALPYLSGSLEQDVLNYLQSEFNEYPPYNLNHIGWNDGAAREAFDLPPEAEIEIANHPPQSNVAGFEGWNFAPQTFYALWKYAAQFGNAQTIYNLSAGKLPDLPADSVLLEMPYVQNAFIAGYYGFLQLEALAGAPVSTGVEQDLDSLISMRLSTFNMDAPDIYFEDGNFEKFYCRTINLARNFMYLTPELASSMRSNPTTLSKVQEALNEYQTIAPYWFESRAEFTYGEGIFNPLQDNHALFHAKAWILQESPDQLKKFLDVPAFARGDLYYIDKLITLLDLQ
jgi:outer membrane protein assembly factor BamB